MNYEAGATLYLRDTSWAFQWTESSENEIPSPSLIASQVRGRSPIAK